MLVLESTHDRVLKQLKDEKNDHEVTKIVLRNLRRKWNDLVDQVNKLGGEDFLLGNKVHPKAKQASQFTDDEIKDLIWLAHPDKHQDSPRANRITKKLLSLKK